MRAGMMDRSCFLIFLLTHIFSTPLNRRIFPTLRLQAHPYLQRRAEVSAKPDRGVCGDRTLAVHNGAYASGGDDDVAGEPVYADPHRPHQFLKEDFPWVIGHNKRDSGQEGMIVEADTEHYFYIYIIVGNDAD
jgi:hypothetical protein